MESFENIWKRRDVRWFKRFMRSVRGNDETACPSPVHMFLLSDSDNRRHFQTQILQGYRQLCSVLSMFPLYPNLCFRCSFLFPFSLILSLAESPQPAFRQFPPWHWISGVGLWMWIGEQIPRDSLYTSTILWESNIFCCCLHFLFSFKTNNYTFIYLCIFCKDAKEQMQKR